MYRLSLANIDIIISIINLDGGNSHLFYINQYGLMKASTVRPQPNVDYDSKDQVRISGVDMV